MEQNATNKEEKKVITNKDLPWYSKSYNILVLIAVVGIGFFIHGYQEEKAECEKAVKFFPATESVVSNSEWVASKQGEAEYYNYYLSNNPEWKPKVFKTRQEAVKDCMLII